MSKVSGCMWLAVALVLALVAGGIAFVTLQKATVTQAESAAPVETTQVVVAAHPIPIGARLTDVDLTTQTLPTGALPAGAVTAIEDATDKLTTVTLEAGEMILDHHLTTPDITGSNLAFTLPAGLVAVSLGAEDLLSSVGVIKGGDKVDILYSLQFNASDVTGVKTSGGASVGSSNEPKQWTFGTLQGVTVVNVVYTAAKDTAKADSNGSTPVQVGAARAYILALPPQDALVLKYLKDAGATMDLAMRNVADDGDHATDPVDLKYLVDKFQLRAR